MSDIDDPHDAPEPADARVEAAGVSQVEDVRTVEAVPEPPPDSAAAPTMVVPQLKAPVPEQPAEVVPQQEQPTEAVPQQEQQTTEFMPQQQRQATGPAPFAEPAPAPGPGAPGPGAQGYAASGAYPSGPPPAPAFAGQYPPYQGFPPNQPPFQQYPQQPQAPARPAGPPPVTGYDLVASAYDAVRALAAGFVSILVALLLVIYAGIANAHVPLSYAYKLTCWLLGSSLGAPITGSGNVSADDGLGSSLSAALDITLRVTVWALTFLVLFLVYVLARGRERRAPSRSLGQLFLRSALTGLAVSLILLVLALTSQVSDLFDNAALGSATGLDGMTGSVGLSAGFVFLGPLLLTLAVGLLGRFGVWLQAPTTADPRAQRAKAAIDLWRPAVRTAWQQMSVMGTLIAVGLWIWLAVEVFQSPDTGPYRTAMLLGLLVLLPNLAVYGTFIGMGVTLFVGGGVGASVLGQSSSQGLDGSPGSGSTALGILQGAHPWGVWLLFCGVLVGTLAPAVLARNSRRFAVNRDEYAMNGAWRSVVVGLATALVVVLLGALSVSFTGSAGILGSMNATVSLGPSLLGALGLTALWFLLAYLALSLSLGHRFQPVTLRQPSGIPRQGTPEYAQYLAYQQYLAQQQQQYPVPPFADPMPAADPTVTVPLATSGTQELPPDSSQTPLFPQPVQADPGQQYAQQYPQQYAQPYPQQQFPPQWAPPGQSPLPQTGQWVRQPGMPGTGGFGGLRQRMQPKIVIPLVLVVLAGAGYLTYHLVSGNSQSGPGGAVSAYFGDLAAGDAKDAAALAVTTSTDVKVLDSAATLGDAANRPTDFSVVTTRKPTAQEQQELSSAKISGTNLTMVIVKYTVRGKQLSDMFIAVQNAQGKWVLPNPYLYVSVSGGWSDTATVDGVSFTAEDGAYVFPGAHVIAEPDNPDFTAESTTIVPVDQTSDGDTYAAYGTDDGEVTLPDPSLSSEGQDAVQKAYSDALDDCATVAETGESDCGIDNYYDYYVCNSVTWTITTVGTVDVDMSSSDDHSFDWTSDGTVASESGDYYDYFDDDQTFSDQPTDLENDGTVVFNSDGSATVTITD